MPVHLAVVNPRVIKAEAQATPEAAQQRLMLAQDNRHLEDHL